MTLRKVAALAAILLSIHGAGFAQNNAEEKGDAGKEIVIPDATAISEEDDKAIRQMLSEYYKVVQSGDREKAYAFCAFKGKQQEKVCKLAVDADFVLLKLKAAVEKKFGKEEWGHIGKMVSEMNPEVLKSVKLEPTDNPDEVMASWNEEADVGKDRSIPSTVKLIKAKSGWKFVFDGEKDELVELRKQFRDQIAEMSEIVAKVEDGTFKDVAALKDALNEMIKELVGDVDEGDAPMEDPAPPGAAPIGPMIPE